MISTFKRMRQSFTDFLISKTIYCNAIRDFVENYIEECGYSLYVHELQVEMATSDELKLRPYIKFRCRRLPMNAVMDFCDEFGCYMPIITYDDVFEYAEDVNTGEGIKVYYCEYKFFIKDS